MPWKTFRGFGLSALTSLAFGFPSLVMTNSFPAATHSSNADKCAFASRIVTDRPVPVGASRNTDGSEILEAL